MSPTASHSRSSPVAALRRLALVIALVMAVALAVPGCSDTVQAKSDIMRIGLVLPFEGDAAAWAEDVVTGLKLGLGEEAYGVEILRRDDRGDPTRAAEFVYELTTDQGVSAIVGPLMTACGLAAAERAQALGVPLITPTATHDAITADRPWVFRTCFTDRQQGVMLARYARSRLGLERVAIIKDISNEYSLGLSEAFASEFLRRWGDVAVELTYRSGAVSPERLAASLKDVEFDAVYIPGYVEDAAQVIATVLTLVPDDTVTFLGGDGWNGDDLREAADQWPSRLFYTSHYVDDPGDAAVQAFVEEYAQLLLRESHTRNRQPGAVPETTAPANAFVALGYDTGVLLREVIRAGGRNREGIRIGLETLLPTFAGVTGSFSRPIGSDEPRKQPIVLGWEPSSATWFRAN